MQVSALRRRKPCAGSVLCKFQPCAGASLVQAQPYASCAGASPMFFFFAHTLQATIVLSCHPTLTNLLKFLSRLQYFAFEHSSCGGRFFGRAAGMLVVFTAVALRGTRFDPRAGAAAAAGGTSSLLSLIAFVACFSTLLLFSTPIATSSLLSLIAFIATAFLAGGLAFLSTAFEAHHSVSNNALFDAGCKVAAACARHFAGGAGGCAGGSARGPIGLMLVGIGQIG